jgi:hypothetical protein
VTQYDNRQSALFGNDFHGDALRLCADGHVLSSIRICAQSSYYGGASCAIFGFQPEDPSGVRPPPETVHRLEYVARHPLGASRATNAVGTDGDEIDARRRGWDAGAKMFWEGVARVR